MVVERAHGAPSPPKGPRRPGEIVQFPRRNILQRVWDTIRHYPGRSALAALTGAAAGAGVYEAEQAALNWMSGRAVASDTSKPSQQKTVDENNNQFVAPIATETAAPKAIPKPADTATAPLTKTTTPAPTETPAPYEPPKPAEEKTFSNGATEKYDMINERNAEKYLSFVSEEEEKKLLQQQPGKILFPFSPKGKFSIGTFQYQDGTKFIVIYCPEVYVSAPEDGNYLSYGGKGISKTTGDTNKNYQLTTMDVYGSNPKIEFDSTFTNSRATKKQGENLLKFSGAGSYNNGSYEISANRIDFRIVQVNVINPGRPVTLPDGRKVTMDRDEQWANATPDLTDLDKWVTKDGKIVVKRQRVTSNINPAEYKARMQENAQEKATQLVKDFLANKPQS